MKTTFFSFRCLITDNQQISFFKQDRDKSEVFQDMIDKIIDRQKIIHNINGKQYIVTFKQVVDNLIAIKFSIETTIIKHDVTDNDIQDNALPDFPYTIILIDIEKQLLLIQHKSTVFPSVTKTSLEMQKFFARMIENDGYSVVIEPLLFEEEFWKFVADSDLIYEVGLSLTSPNLFKANAKATDELKDIENKFNNSTIDVVLKNKKGFLKVSKEYLETFIVYITAGGGNWSLHAKYQNQNRKLNSKKDGTIKTIQVDLNDDNDNELLSNNKESIINQINVIDHVMGVKHE